MVITERQEEVLSYLVGMAPLGQTFACERRFAASDLCLPSPSLFNHALNRLADVGAVFVESKGLHGVPSLMRVVKRPEAFAVVSPAWRRACPSNSPSKARHWRSI